MIKKLIPLFVALSTCIITINSVIKATTITVDATFLNQHHEPFKEFIRSMGRQKKIVDKVSWFPGGKKLVQIGAQFAGYAKEIKDLPYLDRYFQNEGRQMQIIDSLKSDLQYQNLASEYVSNVFDALDQQPDKGRDAFLRVLHVQNIRTLGQPEGTTRERLCTIVNIRYINGERAISDDLYFKATTLSLFTLYLYENGR